MSLVTLSFVFLILGCSVTEPTSSQPLGEPDPRNLPRVTVPLLGSTRDVRGMELPEGLHAERVGSADLLKPHLLTVRLSNGRELTLPVRSMSFISLDGVIISVYARRPMQPTRFKESVADLRETMKSLGIEPDEKMIKKIATWGDDNPGREEGANPLPHFFKTGMIIEPEIGHLHVHVQPDPERGWFYLMNFGASVEASQAAQAAAKASKANGPPAEP